MKRVLLDENLPRLLARDLPGHEVSTVAEAGWAGTTNGALLRLAESQFDVFVTADRRLPHQQTLAALELGFVILQAGSTKLEDLRRHAAAIGSAIEMVNEGQVAYVPEVRGR